ncbi:hypothetical protein HBB16_14945 [Pseudonocardia sp. MCCB 268]|nr:hypothetical protein [Pseudonocardia cytotoxica]
MHLGCGLDSRPLRVGARAVELRQLDVDQAEVVDVRRRLYTRSPARCPGPRLGHRRRLVGRRSTRPARR